MVVDSVVAVVAGVATGLRLLGIGVASRTTGCSNHCQNRYDHKPAPGPKRASQPQPSNRTCDREIAPLPGRETVGAYRVCCPQETHNQLCRPGNHRSSSPQTTLGA